MLYQKREKFKFLEKFLVKLFRKFHPNFLTSFTLIFALFGAVSLFFKNLFLGAVFFFFSFLFDFVDGAVARATKRVSIKGAFFDTISDRIVEFLFFLGLFFLNPPQFFLPFKLWVLLALFFSMMITYSKAAAFEKGLLRKEKKIGFFSRPERCTFYMGVLIGGIIKLKILSFFVALIAILCFFCFIERVIYCLKIKV